MTIHPDMQVLIVDDHSTMLRIVRNLLAQINLNNVDEAKDGQEALQKLARKKYQLVLSDWNMEPMTGLQLLQFVRSDPTYQHVHVPFIMITAEARPENVAEAKKAGVDNYVIKPFNADTLESKIKNVLLKKG